MNESIRQDIVKIKELIGKARFQAGFIKLESVIKDLEALNSEDDYLNELYNQLIVIKARYHQFDQSQILGTDDDDTEINQITVSVLRLVDEVRSIAEELAPRMAPTTQGPARSHTPQTAVPPPAGGKDKKGCLLAFAGDDVDVKINVKKKGLGFIFLTGLILLGASSFLLLKTFSDTPRITDHTDNKSRDTGNETPASGLATNKPNNDNNKTDSISNTVLPDPGLKSETAQNFGFKPNSLGTRIANHLDDKPDELPHAFATSKVKFKGKTDQLNAAGKAELDELVKCLKHWNQLTVDIYGYTGSKEPAKFKNGNKEFSRDAVRAKKVMNYLKSKGIASKRMDFYGDGTDDDTQVVIELVK